MKIIFEWEKMSETFTDVHRVKVIGGWIVHTQSQVGESMIFISDPNHEWEPVRNYMSQGKSISRE
jgi:hypothetical protein